MAADADTEEPVADEIECTYLPATFNSSRAELSVDCQACSCAHNW